jgi:UDP-N-acetylglucosamine transferase subunit ALG13
LTTEEQLVVQYGPSGFRPQGAECVDYLSHDQFRAHVGSARVVVIHAGAGSIITTLALGKHPIVVPRRALHGEAVDDHQLPFARRAGELGLVTVVEDLDCLADAIATRSIDTDLLLEASSSLERELSAFIEGAVGVPASTPARELPRTAWS